MPIQKHSSSAKISEDKKTKAKNSVSEEKDSEKIEPETAITKDETVADNKGESTKRRSATDVNDALNIIRTKFGEDSIMKLGDKPKVNVNAIPTGSLGLDWALGIGGMPRGRIIEIFGPESSGKTTLALHVVAEAQKRGGVSA